MNEVIESIVQRLPLWQGEEIHGITEIQGGWMNRNYKVDVGSGSYMLRLNGETTHHFGINRQQESEIAKFAGESGLSPRVIYCHPTDGVMITEFLDGKNVTRDDLTQAGNIQRLAQTLRKVHSLQVECTPFCPFEKATQWIRTAHLRGIDIPDQFASVIERMTSVKTAAYAQSFPHCLCHNDFVLGNILDNGSLHVIDWEHAGLGNPLFDLASLVMNGQLTPDGETILLETYFENQPVPHRNVLIPWKRAFDFLNGAFYLLQVAVSKQGINYHHGVMHHFTRLMKETVNISLALTEDANEILTLQKLAYQSEAELYHDWTVPPLTQTIESLLSELNEMVILKATVGERLVGSVRAKLKGDTCVVGRLIVHPDYQHQGIGSELLRRIESKFPEADAFELFTGSLSVGNIRLYQRHGYAITRQEKLSDAVTIVFLVKPATVK